VHVISLSWVTLSPQSFSYLDWDTYKTKQVLMDASCVMENITYNRFTIMAVCFKQNSKNKSRNRKNNQEFKLATYHEKYHILQEQRERK